MADNIFPATALSEDAVKNRFKTAFRRRVGTGRDWSVVALAAETAIPERDLRAYQDQSGCLPNLSRFLVLSIALGADFLGEIVSVAGFDGIRQSFDHDDNPHTAQAALAKGVYQLAKWLEDGKFDHRERREAIPAVLAIIGQLQAFVAGLQAGQGE